MTLLMNLEEMNEDKDMSLARFGLVPMGSLQVVARFVVPAMLEAWAPHLLDIFPNPMMHSKAKKVVVEHTFSNLCAAMRHMEVTLFSEMNEDFYLCRDAIDDVESINFEVDAIYTHLSNLAKEYHGKTKFGTVKGDMAKRLDEWIKEQVEHIAEMQKSLAETKKLILKLKEGLVSAKAYLGSLNQEKEHLNSSGVTELCQSCIEVAKAFGDEPGPFLP
ncbi:hypothetical protein SLE2022_236080 [Rubroshorea leprosula]